jgi:hypothetical protein
MSDEPRRVILESPYGSPRKLIVRRNVLYARAAVRDSLLRGEAPIASHLLYTQDGVLDDTVPDERAMGIAAGLAWRAFAAATVVYIDLGTTPGMQHGIRTALAAGIPVDYRKIGEGWRSGRWWLPR